MNFKESRVQHEQLSLSRVDGDEIKGRSVFIIETTGKGILVQTSFETEDGRLLEMPAIFPNIEYALAQIDEMRLLVIRKFSQAACIGIESISADLLKKKIHADALAFIAAHENDL